MYDQETAAFFRNSTHITVDSLDKGVRKNADGSVDIYVGPKAPTGMEFELDLHPTGEELVSVVSLLRPGKGDLRQELAVAGH